MADVLAVHNAYRTENWTTLIQECSASGLSNREFCRQHGISEKSFYYWLRKLRNEAAEASDSHLVKLDLTPTGEDMLHIRFRSAELHLPSEVDMDVVSALLRSLQSL